MRLQHVILTRFNLATPGREEAIRNREGWLERRFELFEWICLPAIAAQTNQNFLWIIYFDEHTPQVFKDRIAKLQETFPFVAYYTGLFPGDGWPRSVREVLAERGIEPEVILSTRLDNDDGLALDYVDRIQKAAEGQDITGPTFFNIRAGCIMGNDRIYTIDHPSNAFFSVAEPFGGDFKTAFATQHMTIADHGPVVQLSGTPGWLQLVHGENVSNKIRGRRIAPETMTAHFAPEAIGTVPTPSGVSVLLENAVLTPIRSLRDKLLALRSQRAR